MKIIISIASLLFLASACMQNPDSKKQEEKFLKANPQQKELVALKPEPDTLYMRQPKSVSTENTVDQSEKVFQNFTELYNVTDSKGNTYDELPSSLLISNVTENRIDFENGIRLYFKSTGLHRVMLSKDDNVNVLYRSHFAGTMYGFIILSKERKNIAGWINEGSNNPVKLTLGDWEIQQAEKGRILSDNVSETITTLPVSLSIKQQRISLEPGKESILTIEGNKYRITLLHSTFTKTKSTDSFEALPYNLQMIITAE